MISMERDGARMDISPKGAEMRAYQGKDGRPWLWSGDPQVWSGTSPLLFPVIGQLKGKKVSIQGQDYHLPKHGFTRDQLFQVVEQGEGFCTLALEDNAETRTMYPFAFRLTVTHSLLAEGFASRYCVENRGTEPMPFAIGGHPAFALPMEEGAAFDEYLLRFELPEAEKNLPCLAGGLMGEEEHLDLGEDCKTLSINRKVFEAKDSLVLPGIHSRYADLVHKETGRGLRVHFPNATCLALWTKGQAPFLCVEPWNGLPAFENETGCFEDKPYHIRLKNGERFAAEFSVERIG